MTAPPARRRRTTSLSRCAVRVIAPVPWHVVSPAMSTLSLTAMGTPSRGALAPASRRCCAATASALAASARTVRKALSRGLSRWIRSRQTSRSSCAETSPDRRDSAWAASEGRVALSSVMVWARRYRCASGGWVERGRSSADRLNGGDGGGWARAESVSASRSGVCAFRSGIRTQLHRPPAIGGCSQFASHSGVKCEHPPPRPHAARPRATGRRVPRSSRPRRRRPGPERLGRRHRRRRQWPDQPARLASAIREFVRATSRPPVHPGRSA